MYIYIYVYNNIIIYIYTLYIYIHNYIAKKSIVDSMNRSLLLNQMSTHIFRYFYASPRPDKIQVEIQGLRCFWCIVNASASIAHE